MLNANRRFSRTEIRCVWDSNHRRRLKSLWKRSYTECFRFNRKTGSKPNSPPWGMVGWSKDDKSKPRLDLAVFWRSPESLFAIFIYFSTASHQFTGGQQSPTEFAPMSWICAWGDNPHIWCVKKCYHLSCIPQSERALLNMRPTCPIRVFPAIRHQWSYGICHYLWRNLLQLG